MNIAGKDIHALFDETIAKLRVEIERNRNDYEARVTALVEKTQADFKTTISLVSTPDYLFRGSVAFYVLDEVYAGYDYECPAVRLMVENISLEMNRGQYRNGPGEHSQPVFKKGQKYRFIVAAVPIKET